MKKITLLFVCYLFILDLAAQYQHGDPGIATVEVAALQLDNPFGQTHVQDLIFQTLNHLDALEANHPNVDAVVTPEYNFYQVCHGCPASGLVLNKSGDHYVIDEANSDALYVDLFEKLQAKAISMNTYIMAGTFPEKYFPDVVSYPFMPSTVTFNVMLIINRQGVIEDIDRKMPSSDWIQPLPQLDFNKPYDPIHTYYDPTDPYYIRAVELVNSTSYVRQMKNAAGETFNYVPVICQERPDPRMLNEVAQSGETASVIFYSEREGDVQYQFLTENINGLPITFPGRDFTADWQFFLEQHPAPSFNAVQSEGYLVGAERSTGAGIIQFQQESILDIDITDNYAYGKIAVPMASNTLSIDDVELATSNIVYPNPTVGGELFVNISQFSVEDDVKIMLYDISGRIILQSTKDKKSINDLLKLDVSSFQNGIYLLAIQLDDRKRISKKILLTD